jgi:CheY-like chemotaxis protein
MAETSGDKASGAEAARAARIGSARSDFISSLGRRVVELRASLNGLEQDPGSPRLRDDLRRRVHALSAGARLLRFSGMAAALGETERMLERAAAVGGLDKTEIKAIAQLLESLPTLAWNEPTHEQRATERPPPSAPIGEQAAIPPTVLVVGPPGLADAITQSIDHPAENDVECERTETPFTGLELARALAPDVAVVDADLPGARELVEKLGRDPLTEPMPLIVVGTWSVPEDGAKWIAAGATRALAKPVSPHELRKACFQLSSGADEPIHHMPLGETTVEELTATIVEEVKRGLPGALIQGKATPIQLGDGSDILAAVWGAVARVRDLVMIKSNGAVRFSGYGPEGALPFAPWWGDSPTGAQRGVERGSDAKESDQPLEGRKVVVADDDPAVTWFVGGVLRAAGAKVREAHDGDRALELCFRLSPDLVVSDVLMPGLDGFALCRALKRDIALRDVPVILLSWKEDLLQRLRDLGADADGYLRKEASAAAILQRVHEVLRPRARIEARLKGEGEVRGRLDGVTPRTLLEAISQLRPDARLCIRDASFLYEVELRGGEPKSATRTTSDGAFQRGKEVFAALLGVRAGRFVASKSTGPARGTLEGTLEEQMEAPVAHARAALRLLGGTRLLEVHRVDIAVDRVLAYLAATPEPARSLVTRLANGASPRGLILGSEIAPAQLEEVLCDLATHGAISGVFGAGATDLLGPALDHELSAIRRGGTPSNRPPKDVKVVVVDQGVARTKTPDPPKAATPRPTKSGSAALPPIAATPLPSKSGSAALPPVTATPLPPKSGRVEPARPPKPAPLPPPPTAGTPRPPPPRKESPSSSKVQVGPDIGMGQVMGVGESAAELPARTPMSTTAVSLASTFAAIEVKPVPASGPHLDAQQGSEPWPLDAVGEERTPSSLEAAVIREISDRRPVPTPPPNDAASTVVHASELRARALAATVASDLSPRVSEPSLPPDAIVPASSTSEDRIRTSALATTGLMHAATPPPETSSAIGMTTLQSAAMPPMPPARKPNRAGSISMLMGALGLLGIALAGYLDRYMPDIGEKKAPMAPSSASAAPAAFEQGAPAPSATLAAPAPSTTEALAASAPATEAPLAASDEAMLDLDASAAAPNAGEDLPLPAGAVITPGQGLLDIETGGREAIFVDGVELGRGPFLRLTIAPGVHDVRLRAHGEEKIKFAMVRSARRTRLPFASTWTR